MIPIFNRLFVMTLRVLNQLRRDKRFLAISTLFPMIIIYFIKVVFDVLASPSFNISTYIVPYAAFIVHFITFILTAIVLVRERTAGTMAQMFVSGYQQIEIIIGYLVAYTVLATLQSLLVLLELNWLFDLGFSSIQMTSMYLVMWLLAIISMAIGMLVSNFARNEGQVFPFIPLVILSVILSGIIVPVEKLPDWAQVLSYLTPLYYANEILQELIRGGTLMDSKLNLLILPLYGLVVVAMVAISLREKD
ncbi:MAG: ABC transporter permease [Chloroflexi bacterium HGW-Chloroflexi-8]|nr:MAG: ABC transporter permease [Chloroflexi bacterium HGW-Chloroflexi-8]